MLRIRTLMIFALIAATTATACGGSSSPSVAPTTTTATQPATTTTTALSASDAAKLYQERGPYPVGVLTETLPEGNKVEIWYPAVEGSNGKETYDVKDFTSPEVKALLTADVDATRTYDATRDAAGAVGKFPVVLFSHGFSGMRVQSTFLTSHLASWGMIVASADHPSRDLFHILGGAPKQDSVADVEAALAMVRSLGADKRSPLNSLPDFDHVAAVGHSAGGGTAVGASNRIAEVDGYVSLASGLFRGATTSTSVGVTTTTVAIPSKPSLFVAGANDQIADPKTVTRAGYEAAATPTRLWVIDKAGHNAFDDFCTLGGGAGIIGIAEASGLGPLLTTGPLKFAKTLGEDGCKPPNVPVAEVYPIINHVVVAWLRNLFGTTPSTQGLGADVAGEFSVGVTIEERLG